MRHVKFKVWVLLIIIGIGTVNTMLSCVTARSKQERENYRIKPFYQKEEMVYLKSDSLQVKIVSMRRSGAGPVYLVSYKNKYGWMTEQVMEFEIFK